MQHSYNLLLIYVYNLLVNCKHKFVNKSFDTASFLLFCLIENFSLFWWHLHYYDIIYWGSYTAECQTRYKSLICRECCRLSYPFNTRIDQHDMTCWSILVNSPHKKKPFIPNKQVIGIEDNLWGRRSLSCCNTNFPQMIYMDSASGKRITVPIRFWELTGYCALGVYWLP